MLYKAVQWIFSIYDTIGTLDEGLQMSILEVIRADCKNDSAHRVSLALKFPIEMGLICYVQSRYIRCILDLLNASSHAVKYKAATTLTTLTQNPAAVKDKVATFS